MRIVSNCPQDAINKAAQALIEGHLVAFPTETVYGLGADASNSKAVARVYEVKARPTDHPLIVHISSINQMNKWARDIPDYAITLARKFWPGPMTLILKRSDLAKNFITGNQENVGLRVPSDPVALSLLLEFEAFGGFGIAAPSANRFGAVSPTSAEAVKEELGKNLLDTDIILDNGVCTIGIESTIINCLEKIPSILRPGAITAEMISVAVGIRIEEKSHDEIIKSSGQLNKHYSPKAHIQFSDIPITGQGFIGLASIRSHPDVIRLASPKNLTEYSNQLYSALRLADSMALDNITVALPKGRGLAWAIRDRIEKAAGKKNI
jgi:L-threonylcarbamoyladenylate synthase